MNQAQPHQVEVVEPVQVSPVLVDEAMGGKQVIDPEMLPWDAIRTTLCKGIFGGRITKGSDQKILDEIVSALFVPTCFDVNFYKLRPWKLIN